jgi:methionyl-tRNA formyltransferase
MILTGATSCGVTLQTLDDKSFDNGLILAQTPQKLSKIPYKDRITYEELLDHLTPMAAKLLVLGIRNRLFVPPLINAGWYAGKILHHAPKITAADREINWLDWNSTYIERHARALGRLWNRVLVGPFEEKRFIFEDAEAVPLPDAIQKWFDHNQRREILDDEMIQDGTLVRFIVHRVPAPKNNIYASLYVEDGDAIIIAPNDLSKGDKKQGIRVKEITVEGMGKKPARQAMQIIEERTEWFVSRNGPHMTLQAERLGLRIRRYEYERGTPVRGMGTMTFKNLRLSERVQTAQERRIKSKDIIEQARENYVPPKAQENEKSS